MTDTVNLSIVTPAGARTISAARGNTILAAAHAGGVEIDSTCGARGR